MPFMDWPESWSPERPYFFPRDDPYAFTCAAQGPVALGPGSHPHERFVWCAMEIDKDDNVTFGQQVRDNCIHDIELATTFESSDDNGKKRPFFM